MAGNGIDIIVAQANGAATAAPTTAAAPAAAPAAPPTTTAAPAATSTVPATAAPEAPPTTTGTHTPAIEPKEVFPPFDPSTFASQIFWLVITFLALYLILSRAALPRLGGIIETRRQRIAADLSEADRLRKETDASVASHEAALAAARRDAQSLANDTRASIRTEIDARRQQVEAGLAQRVGEAESRIQASKTAALANVDAIAAETAQALVERLSGQTSLADATAAVAQVKGQQS